MFQRIRKIGPAGLEPPAGSINRRKATVKKRQRNQQLRILPIIQIFFVRQIYPYFINSNQRFIDQIINNFIKSFIDRFINEDYVIFTDSPINRVNNRLLLSTSKKLIYGFINNILMI